MRDTITKLSYKTSNDKDASQRNKTKSYYKDQKDYIGHKDPENHVHYDGSTNQEIHEIKVSIIGKRVILKDKIDKKIP